MLHSAIRRPFHGGVLSSLMIMLASVVGCADEESGRDSDDLDAGIVFDASRPTPPPDLRFKWVGVQPRAQIDLGTSGLFSRPDDPGTGLMIEGAVGALPLGFVDLRRRAEADADAATAPAVDVGATDGGAAIGDASVYDVGVTFHSLFTPLSPIEPMRVHRQLGSRGLFEGDFEMDLEEVTRSGMIISAIDLVPGSCALVSVGEARLGTPYRGTATFVPRSGLADWLTRASEARHVVTAISGAGDRMFVAAYARDDDPRRYEAKVVEASFDNLIEHARSLADEGYIITAFGRDGTRLLLVGTRPIGEHAPREMFAMTLDQARAKLQYKEGFAIVAWVRQSSFPYDEGGLVVIQR